MSKGQLEETISRAVKRVVQRETDLLMGRAQAQLRQMHVIYSATDPAGAPKPLSMDTLQALPFLLAEAEGEDRIIFVTPSTSMQPMRSDKGDWLVSEHAFDDLRKKMEPQHLVQKTLAGTTLNGVRVLRFEAVIAQPDSADFPRLLRFFEPLSEHLSAWASGPVKATDLRSPLDELSTSEERCSE